MMAGGNLTLTIWYGELDGLAVESRLDSFYLAHCRGRIRGRIRGYIVRVLVQRGPNSCT